MTRAGTVLPTVVTTAARNRGPADTVRKLELVGFYERRQKSGAAPMAFVLGDKIRDMSTFDDFQSRTGRGNLADNARRKNSVARNYDFGGHIGFEPGLRFSVFGGHLFGANQFPFSAAALVLALVRDFSAAVIAPSSLRSVMVFVLGSESAALKA